MPKPFIVQDPYFFKAKQMGYRARSAFKLLEIDEKFHLVESGMTVIDVASAPGSFLQVLSRMVGPTGRVVGFDIQTIEKMNAKNVTVFVQDVLKHEEVSFKLQSIGISRADLITSDIAPNTTGITGVDQYRSVELNLAILDLAKRFLKTGGNLMLKVFVGEDVNDLVQPLKNSFDRIVRFKPKACRDRSFEEYFICFAKR
jgi:23S rRNA (uridine2552-2'-O)-methyltransferase